MLDRSGKMFDWSKVRLYKPYKVARLLAVDLGDIATLANHTQQVAIIPVQKAPMEYWVGLSILKEDIGGGAVITTDLGQILVQTIYNSYREPITGYWKAHRRLLMQTDSGHYARADWAGEVVGEIVFSPVPFDQFGRPKLLAHLYPVVRIICMSNGPWNGPALARALKNPNEPLIADETAVGYLLELEKLALMKPFLDEKSNVSKHLFAPAITRDEFIGLFGA